jgi:hypothetical protein
MSGRRISVSTAKSLHNPLEVEINGKVYEVKLNRPIFQKLAEIEKEYKKLETEKPGFDAVFLLYDQVELMTGAPKEDISQLDFTDLKVIVEFVMTEYYKPPKTEEAKEEKNGLKPGEVPVQ